MAKIVTSYKVFISSPSDIEQDRLAVREAVMACNKLVESKDVVFQTFMWEMDVASSFGKSGQDIISEQLGDYDFYIGLMANRFGSPTARYGSGTEEEFFDALEKYRDGNLKKVSFLFAKKEVDVLSLPQSRILEFAKIAAFIESIQPLGLYSSYTDKASLQACVTQILLTSLNSDIRCQKLFDNSLAEGDNDSRSLDRTISVSFRREFLSSLDRNIWNGVTVDALENLWVDIDLRLTIRDKLGGITHEDCNAAEIIPKILAGCCYLICGNQTSGTTTLCKKLFTETHRHGSIPVFLDGGRIKSGDTQRLDARVITEITNQYERISQSQAKTIGSKKIIVIIDDFDLISLNVNTCLSILHHLYNKYASVVISTSATYTFAVIEATKDASVFGYFIRAEIQELSNKNRYAIIEKWYRAQDDIALTEDKIVHKIERARSDINRILITHIVPRTPLIVLVLLKAIENDQTTDLAQSGYVRYYKFLIDNAILRGLPLAEAEYAYALLPELAWATYEGGTGELDDDTAEAVIDAFSEKRALRRSNLYGVLRNLRAIGMFSPVGSALRFQHSYAHNFFLTDYISRNMRHESMQSLVKGLCQKTWSRETANILVFLSFHNDSDLVTECLIAQLRGAYINFDEFDLHGIKTQSINRLINEAPKQISDEAGAAEGRTARLEAEDQAERSLGKADDNHGAPLGQMGTVFAAIEVLGHILRNHYARLDAGSKRTIYEVSTSAILRCLESFFEHLSSSVELLVSIFASTFDQLQPDISKEQKENAAREVVFIFAVTLLYYCSKVLARAVGDENLEITYEQVTKTDPTPIKSLLDLAIKLDCFQGFPEVDLQKVVGIIKGNYLGESALRAFVAERLDFRPPGKTADFRRYCNIVGLDTRLRLIEQMRLGSQPEIHTETTNQLKTKRSLKKAPRTR